MAPHRRPAEAVDAYLSPLASVISCFTQEIVQASGWFPATEPHSLIVGRGDPFHLKAPRVLCLQVRQRYEIERDPADPRAWRIRTSEYAYEYVVPDDGRYERVVAYHWHPRGAAPTSVSYPHLHIGKALTSEVFGQPVVENHFPTERVALEDVLGLGVKEFHVSPIRTDCESVLRRTKQEFIKKRSWSFWPG